MPCNQQSLFDATLHTAASHNSFCVVTPPFHFPSFDCHHETHQETAEPSHNAFVVQSDFVCQKYLMIQQTSLHLFLLSHLIDDGKSPQQQHA